MKKLLRGLVFLVIAIAILSSGVPIGLIIIAIPVWFFFRRRRRSREGQASTPKVPEANPGRVHSDNRTESEEYDRLRTSGWPSQAPWRKRTHIPAGLKYAVLKRDNRTCQLCGAKAPDVELHVDHIVPLSRGGTTTIDNLQTLCAPCNLGKGDRDDTDWRRRRGGGSP